MTSHGLLVDRGVAQTHAKFLRRRGYHGVRVVGRLDVLGRAVWEVVSSGFVGEPGPRSTLRRRLENDVEEGAGSW